MEIWLFSFLIFLFAFLTYLSTRYNLLHFGFFGGVFLLIIFFLMMGTGIEVPYDKTEIFNSTTNVTIIVQNFTNVLPRDTVTNIGLYTIILGLALYIIFTNMMAMITGRNRQQ